MNRKALTDLAERAAVAFVEGTFAGLTVSAVTSADTWVAALSGGVAAALSVIKSSLATRVGNSESASLSKKI